MMNISTPVYDATMWPASTTINEWMTAKEQPHIWSDKVLKHDVNLEFLNFNSAYVRIGKNKWKSPHLIHIIFNPRPKFLNYKFIVNHNFFLTHLWNFDSLNKEYNYNTKFCQFISSNYLGQTASSCFCGKPNYFNESNGLLLKYNYSVVNKNSRTTPNSFMALPTQKVSLKVTQCDTFCIREQERVIPFVISGNLCHLS